jgi:hypothetical protein
MHLHKIVAQILLTLSILNSVLAAPAVSVRQMHESRGAVEVRVPAEEPRFIESIHNYFFPPQPKPQPSPAGPGHPQQEGAAPKPEPKEVFYDAQPPKSPLQKTMQKTMTTENMKAAKYAGVASLAAAAYLGLLIPTITKNDGHDSQS